MEVRKPGPNPHDSSGHRTIPRYQEKVDEGPAANTTATIKLGASPRQSAASPQQIPDSALEELGQVNIPSQP
jgi:hypothetical protein